MENRTSVPERVRAFLAAITKPGDAVVAAVSGGADSTALLRALVGVRERLGVTVTVCHLHHGLRGAEADGDADFVGALCEKAGVPCVTRRMDIAALAAKKGISVETAGREARYAFFDETADEIARSLPGTARVWIATAHTRNDNAETLLLHLARGSGLRGLCGVPPVRGRIVRPLLDCERGEIEAYLRSIGQDWREDSTNAGDEYARNRVRHEVVPALRALNPRFLECAARASEALRLDEAYLRDAADAALAKARESAMPHSKKTGAVVANTQSKLPIYDRTSLAALPEALLRRCCERILAEAGASADAAKITRLAACVREGRGAVATSAGGDVLATAKRVYSREKRADTAETPFEPGEVAAVGAYCVTASVEENSISRNFAKSSRNNALDYDKIIGKVTLRTRRPGDAIRLDGRGCTKTLKKLFAEAGLPSRDAWPLLADEAGVVWVAGFGVAERAAVTEATKRVLRVEARCGTDV